MTYEPDANVAILREQLAAVTKERDKLRAAVNMPSAYADLAAQLVKVQGELSVEREWRAAFKEGNLVRKLLHHIEAINDGGYKKLWLDDRDRLIAAEKLAAQERSKAIQIGLICVNAGCPGSNGGTVSAVQELRDEYDKMCKIAAFISGAAWIKAKEEAGYGEAVKAK